MEQSKILEVGSGNASSSFNKLKEQSGMIAVPYGYLSKYKLNPKPIRQSISHRTRNTSVAITADPFIEILSWEKRKIAYSVYQSILKKNSFPYFFITTTYKLWDAKKSRWMDKKDRATRWDRYEVEKTNTLIRNKVKEAFHQDKWYAFLEHHSSFTDKNGLEHQGRYHTHSITPSINDASVLQPNRKCRRHLNEYKEWIAYSNPPAEQLIHYGLKSAIGSCEWLKKWDNSINIERIYTELDLANVVCYCLKTYTDANSSLCYNDVICRSSTFAN